MQIAYLKVSSFHHQNLQVELYVSCVISAYRCLMSISSSVCPAGSKLWVLHRDPRGAAVQQGEAAQQRGLLGAWDSSQHTGRLPVQIDSLPAKMRHKMRYLIILLCIKEIICSFADIPLSYMWAVKPCCLRLSELRENINTHKSYVLCRNDGWHCTFMILTACKPCNLCTVCDRLFSAALCTFYLM